MTEHAPLSPSAMVTTVPCPGSVSLQAQVPDVETNETREGDAVHWMGQDMLEAARAGQLKISSLDWVGVEAPNGVVITSEMFEAAYVYYTGVMEVAGKGYMKQLRIEEPVKCDVIHEQCWGTPDAQLWIPDQLTVHNWDLKYGHRSVAAENNYQLVSYDVGLLSEVTGGDPLGSSVSIKVINHIIQPRDYTGAGTHKIWETSNQDLRALVNVMQHSCSQAMSPSSPLSVGEHCYYCKARHICPANQAVANFMVDFAHTAVPHPLSEQSLGVELSIAEKALNLLQTRVVALKAEAETRITSGHRVPGWNLEPTQGRNKWHNPSMIIGVGDMFGVDLSMRDTPCTPAEANRRLKDAGVDGSVINDYYGMTSKGLTLKKDDGSLAAKFSQETT